MGRHRTSRAKNKVIKDIHKKLSNKRNRDLKLKAARKAHVEWKTKQMKQNQAYLDSFGETENRIINASFLSRVERVQTSYQNLLGIYDKSNVIIEVLDARDPQSFRFLDIEGDTLTSQKQLIFLISKADLVPSSIVSQWVQSLSSTAPTIALDLHSPDSIPILYDFIKGFPERTSFGIIGAPLVGKTTLCKLLSQIPEIPKFFIFDSDGWKWTNCNDSLAYTGSLEWRGRIRELCVTFLTRIQGENIFTLLGIPKENSPGNLFNSYARKFEISKQDAPESILKKIFNSEILWYAIPPQIQSENELIQLDYLQKVCSKVPLEKWIALGPGETITKDVRALEFQIPLDSPENSDSDADALNLNKEEEEDDEEEDEE